MSKIAIQVLMLRTPSRPTTTTDRLSEIVQGLANKGWTLRAHAIDPTGLHYLTFARKEKEHASA